MERAGLRDRIALVTGSASGIGAACADRLASDGSTVIGLDIVAHTSPTLTSTAVVDVRDEAGVQRAVREVVDEFGRLDVVVHAAGIAGAGAIDTLDSVDWDRVVDINLKGTYLVDKAALSAMLAHGAGSIVNIASIEGLEAFDLVGAYCASKGGVVQLTRQLALDYGGDGIRVNCICPGFIDTPMTAMLRAPGAEALRDNLCTGTFLGRLGRPEEIAAAASFLASDDASFITGHALVVDGGFTAGHRVGLRA